MRDQEHTDELKISQEEAVPDAADQAEEPVEEEATASEEAPSPEAQIAALRQQLEEEQAKAAEYHDQWLRSVAELRNYKRRVQQERERLAQEAGAGLISHLLPVLDDFQRAMDNLPDDDLLKLTWFEGILIIYRRFQAILEQHGLQPIEAAGKPFDPYYHDAVLSQKVAPEQDGLVVEELQTGYLLNDRVIRPTLVKVGRAVAAPADEEAAPAEPAPQPGEGRTEEMEAEEEKETGEPTAEE